MKKLMLLLTVFSVIMISGCGKSKLEKYQEIMEDYSRQYYEKYQRGINLSSLEVTIDLLKNANDKGENYDLKKLDKCKGSSKVIFTVDEKTRDITSVEYEMKCEK